MNLDNKNTIQITDQLSAQDILNDINHIKTGFAIYDQDLNLVFANHTIRSYLPTLYECLDLGQSMEDSILAQVKVIYPELDAEKHEKRASYIYSRIKTSGTLEVTTPAGRKLNSSYDLTPSGHYIVTTSDVTEWFNNEELLLKSRYEAEAANSAKTEFLTNMSHEIRTPLSGVFLAAQLLQRQVRRVNDPQLDSLAEILVESTNHLSHLINNILDLSKIEAGEVEITRSKNSLADTLKSIKTSQDIAAAEKGIDIGLKIDPDISGHLLYDPVRVRQCITNLVTNALKFTESGRIVIAASMDPDTHMVTIHVADTGSGISAEKQAQIFERFAQADEKSAISEKGSGLGLAISRKLARLMGGDITLKSKIGKGSIFTFTFAAQPISNLSVAGQSLEDEAQKLPVAARA